jgi:hypothetical protein
MEFSIFCIFGAFSIGPSFSLPFGKVGFSKGSTNLLEGQVFFVPGSPVCILNIIHFTLFCQVVSWIFTKFLSVFGAFSIDPLLSLIKDNGGGQVTIVSCSFHREPPL